MPWFSGATNLAASTQLQGIRGFVDPVGITPGVYYADNAGGQLLGAPLAMSVAALVRADASTNWPSGVDRTIAGTWQPAFVGGWRMLAGTAPAAFAFEYFSAGIPVRVNAPTFTAYPASTMGVYLFAVSFNAGAGTVSLYVNGELVTTAVAGAMTPAPLLSVFAIGNDLPTVSNAAEELTICGFGYRGVEPYQPRAMRGLWQNSLNAFDLVDPGTDLYGTIHNPWENLWTVKTDNPIAGLWTDINSGVQLGNPGAAPTLQNFVPKYGW